MLRSALFARYEGKLPTALQAAAYIGAFSLCLALEQFYAGDGRTMERALVSVGMLAGTMVVVDERRWLFLVGVSLLLRIATDLLFPTVGLVTDLTMSVIVIALATMIGAAPKLLLRRHRSDIYPSELVLPVGGTAILAAVIYAVAAGLLLDDVRMITTDLVLTTFAFLIGIMGAGLLVIAFGLPYGLPRRYTPMRLAENLLTSALFLAAVNTGFNSSPTMAAALPGWPEQAFLWFAQIMLVWTCMRASRAVVALNLAGMLAIASLGYTLQIGYFFGDPAQFRLGEWQLFVTGLYVVGITLGAVVADNRRSDQIQRVRRTLAQRLVATNPNDEAASEALVACMRDASRFCGATEMRLNTIERDEAHGRVEFRWLDTEIVADYAVTPDLLDFSSVKKFYAQMVRASRGSILTFDAERPNRFAPLVDLFTLPGNCVCYFHTVFSRARPVGSIMVIAERPDRFSARDVRRLLPVIGDFYASMREQAATRTTVRRYERRLRDLAAKLTQADERIRRHTSVKLHDGLIQQLAVARMKLGELRHRRVSAPDTVDNITAIIDETLAASRRIVNQLSPSVLYELGLVPALESACEEIAESSNFEIHFAEQGERGLLEESLRVDLYQATRELINNALYHSGGSEIWVSVVWQVGVLIGILVADNGARDPWWQPFETGSDTNSGLGLLSVSERLRAHGLAVRFSGRNGGGTAATIFFDSVGGDRANVEP